MTVSLEQLRVGQNGVVRSVAGGRGIVRKLEAMGLRPGKTVAKVSSQLMGGPVIVLLDGRQLAMGRGMAATVLVETGVDS
jgi:ferrous iron transport protein A